MKRRERKTKERKSILKDGPADLTNQRHKSAKEQKEQRVQLIPKEPSGLQKFQNTGWQQQHHSWRIR